MIKTFREIGILSVFIFSIFSCASKAPAIAPSSDALSYESNEIPRSRAGRTSDDERMVAYSLSLTLIVKNIEDTQKILTEQVKANNGFIVKENEMFISARIPAENMDAFVNHAKTLGKVDHESKTGTDITDQYRDNAIRLENLKNVRNRYLALLDKANNVTEILSIEKELQRVNVEIELLEGKIKYAELSVEYSNITVYIKEKAKPGPVGWIFYGIYRGIKWLFIWD